MLKVVHDAEASNENTASGSLLDQIVRDGARQMLAAALQAEVAAYLESSAGELDEAGRHVGQRELPGQVRLLDGVGVHGRTQTCRVGR